MGAGDNLRAYARLSERWYEDAVLAACADREPACMWAWPVLVAMGKRELHAATNPTGEFNTSATVLATTLRIADTDVISRALRVLEEGELITVSPAKMGTFDITVTRLTKWQNAAGSSAERMQAKRDREKAASREKASGSDGRVTGASRPRDVDIDGDGETSSTPPAVRPSAQPPVLRAVLSPASEDDVEFVRSVTMELSSIGDEGRAAAVADGLLFRAGRVHPQTKTRYPLEQWHAAVVEFVQKVRGGWSPPSSDLVGYIIGMVPTAGARLEIDPEKLPVRRGAHADDLPEIVL